MSNAIANSFALLNEIKQELNQPRNYSSKRENVSPSPSKINYSTLISAAANNRNEQPTSLRPNSLHNNSKTSKIPPPSSLPPPPSSTLLSPSSPLSSKFASPSKFKLKSNELIEDLKGRIEEEMTSFSNSCDEITRKINEMIRKIGREEDEGREFREIENEMEGRRRRFD